MPLYCSKIYKWSSCMQYHHVCSIIIVSDDATVARYTSKVYTHVMVVYQVTVTQR